MFAQGVSRRGGVVAVKGVGASDATLLPRRFARRLARGLRALLPRAPRVRRWLPSPAAAASWAVPVLLLVAWQVFGSGSVQGRAGTVPAPTAVLRAGLGLLASGELARHAWVSLQRATVGFVLGGAAGFLLGLAAAYWRASEILFDTPVQMVRNVPHLALIPLVILWFGLGEASKVSLVSLGVLFPMYTNTFHGVRSVDRGLIEMGRLYGLGARRLFFEVVVPGALPSVLVGVRFALGLTWLSLIVAETIGADAGIGYLAMNAREFMQTDVVIFSILVYALLGKAADTVVRVVERVALRWDPRRLQAGSA